MDAQGALTIKSLEQKALHGADSTRIERQKAAGKLTARERINLLLDQESFIETDQLAHSSLIPDPQPTDGVITGYGTVNGRTVALYSQDFTFKGGSLGARHAEKICKIMDMAAKIGCPVIGIIDSGGARIEEGIHALAGYGKIFARNAKYSGVIPQISLIVGPCAGGAVYSPALTDFVFMTKTISQMFITGPQVIQEVLHQTITKEALGGWEAHARLSGVAHCVYDTELDCFQALKELLSYLPSSYLDTPPALFAQSPGKMLMPLPESAQAPYSVKDIINALVDDGSFFEIQALYAQNIVTGLARMGGACVGIVANQPQVKAGCIDIDASCKAARFVSFCDSFSIPIITLVDTPGYLPGIDQEHGGIIRHGAKLLYAYASATTPKITLILRKAFGGAYIVMGSKELGSDLNFAWPTAQIAVLGSKAGVTITHGKELAGLPDDARKIRQAELEAVYEETFLNPLQAAQSGYIDAIIQPDKTREQLIKAVSLLKDKVEKLPGKKHGNTPL